MTNGYVPAVTAVITTAAGAAAFGIPLASFELGAGVCLLGVAMRCGYEIQLSLKRQVPIGWAKIAGWASGGLLGVPAFTVLVLAGLKIINLDSDPAILFGLLIIGFGGQDVIGYLWTAGIGFANKRLGTAFSTNAPESIGGPPHDGH